MCCIVVQQSAKISFQKSKPLKRQTVCHDLLTLNVVPNQYDFFVCVLQNKVMYTGLEQHNLHFSVNNPFNFHHRQTAL